MQVVACSAFNPKDKDVAVCILSNPNGVAACSHGSSAAQPVEVLKRSHPAPAGAADSPAPAGAARINCPPSTGSAALHPWLHPAAPPGPKPPPNSTPKNHSENSTPQFTE